MPLSEEEQRLLEQMEQALAAEDPKFVSTIRGAASRRHHKRIVVLGCLGFVLGVAALMTGAVMMETALSFLGLGLKPEDPSWGQPIEQLTSAGAEKWWLVVFPGIAIFLTVFSYNLVGEALRDALDPKQNK